MRDVLVKRSSAGLGLFANKDYSKEEQIIEYKGEIISAQEGDKRGGKYLFSLNQQWMLDGKSRNNLARYINHSCLPNAYSELSFDETQIFIIAKKPIKRGEEITMNYGKQYFNTLIKPKGCRCQKCLKK